MSLLGLIKDVVLLPVDIALDVTLVTPGHRIVNDTRHEQPFGTFDRLGSMAKNLEETIKK